MAQVADVVVECVQTGAGVPEGGKSGKLSQREGSLDAKMHLTCANPECKKGGFLLRPHVEKAVKQGLKELEVSIPCAGYTGALRTEKGPAAGCANRLKATVKIAYAEPRSPTPEA